MKEYDYSKPGAYFVTICTSNRKSFFGNIADGVMTLSPIGNVIEKFFQEIPNHFTNVTLDEFVVMPNHLHGIIIIQNVGVQNFEPLHKQNRFQHIIPKSLGSIFRAYKSAVTNRCKITVTDTLDGNATTTNILPGTKIPLIASVNILSTILSAGTCTKKIQTKLVKMNSIYGLKGNLKQGQNRGLN